MEKDLLYSLHPFNISHANDGPQDSLRTCHRTSSSYPIKDSQGHGNPNPQAGFVVAVRFVSLLPSSAQNK